MDPMMEAQRMMATVVRRQSAVIVEGSERLAEWFGRPDEETVILMALSEVVSACNGILLQTLADWEG